MFGGLSSAGSTMFAERRQDRDNSSLSCAAGSPPAIERMCSPCCNTPGIDSAELHNLSIASPASRKSMTERSASSSAPLGPSTCYLAIVGGRGRHPRLRCGFRSTDVDDPPAELSQCLSSYAFRSPEPQIVTAQLVDGAATHQLHVAFDFGAEISERPFNASLTSGRQGIQIKSPSRTRFRA